MWYTVREEHKLLKYKESAVTFIPRLLCASLFIYLFTFYIPWIFWYKPHLDIGIVNIDMNTLYNVTMCML